MEKMTLFLSSLIFVIFIRFSNIRYACEMKETRERLDFSLMYKKKRWNVTPFERAVLEAHSRARFCFLARACCYLPNESRSRTSRVGIRKNFTCDSFFRIPLISHESEFIPLLLTINSKRMKRCRISERILSVFLRKNS